MRTNIAKTIALLTIVSVAAFAQASFTDTRDSKKYKTAKIGKQVWMAENLNYDASGSKCYDNKPENCQKYGRLYNWETAMKVCPKGWHLPSEAEWKELWSSITPRDKLKAKSGWDDYLDWEGNKKSGNGTDSYGFAALPGGYDTSGGNFSNAGSRSVWWGSTKYSPDLANYFDIYSNEDENDFNPEFNKDSFYSVRCVKD